MPVDVKISVDAEAALRVLGMSVEEGLGNRIADAIAEEQVLPRGRKYPAPSRKKQPFKSAKQRRYFFAALRSGKITVPYVRTQGLAANTSKQRLGLTGMAVKFTRPYAKFVIGDQDEQADYHKGTWTTVTGMAQEIEADAKTVGIAERIIQEVINRS